MASITTPISGAATPTTRDELTCAASGATIRTTTGASMFTLAARRRSTMATMPSPSTTAAPRSPTIRASIRQYSTGVSARIRPIQAGRPITLTTIATYADTTVNYGFDGDWGNPVLWAPYTYDLHRVPDTPSFDAQLGISPGRCRRQSRFRAGDARLLLAGRRLCLRAARVVDRHQRRDSIIDPFDATQNSDTLTVISSEYRSRNGAVYGQLDGDFSATGTLVARSARRTPHQPVRRHAPRIWTRRRRPTISLPRTICGAAMRRSTIAVARRPAPVRAHRPRLQGRRLQLEPRPAGQPAACSDPSPISISRSATRRRSHGGRLRIDTSLFYMIRRHEQLLTGRAARSRTIPTRFIFYTGNAQSGYNYGLESTSSWAADAQPGIRRARSACCRPNTRASCKTACCFPIGRCRTRPPGKRRSMRPGATHAALLHASTSPAWAPFSMICRRTGRARSPYGLVERQVGLGAGQRWEAYLWGRNLLDKNYTVRGFYFGDEPPDFPNKLYRSWAIPGIGACTSRFATERQLPACPCLLRLSAGWRRCRAPRNFSSAPETRPPAGRNRAPCARWARLRSRRNRAFSTSTEIGDLRVIDRREGDEPGVIALALIGFLVFRASRFA